MWRNRLCGASGCRGSTPRAAGRGACWFLRVWHDGRARLLPSAAHPAVAQHQPAWRVFNLIAGLRGGRRAALWWAGAVAGAPVPCATTGTNAYLRQGVLPGRVGAAGAIGHKAAAHSAMDPVVGAGVLPTRRKQSPERARAEDLGSPARCLEFLGGCNLARYTHFAPPPVHPPPCPFPGKGLSVVSCLIGEAVWAGPTWYDGVVE